MKIGVPIRARLIANALKLLEELNSEHWEGCTVREIVGELSDAVNDECFDLDNILLHGRCDTCGKPSPCEHE